LQRSGEFCRLGSYKPNKIKKNSGAEGESERHACRLLGQWRRTQRYAAIQRIDEETLTEAIVALASEYGRFGYRRIAALLQGDGWQVGKDRVQRIWRREGLKVRGFD